MLARDVTALDVLSGGRAAVLLIGDDLGRLAEAVTVCRLLFTEDAPSYEGRHFTLERAANRPPPVRAGGPPILVAPEVMAPETVGTSLKEADGVVVGGGPAEVAAWRAAVAGPALLRQGSLSEDAEAATLLGAGADGLIVTLSGDAAAVSPAVIERLVAEVDRLR